ncbi:MAG: hypothetical protein M1819_005322 [Sarea resinae]|nr:MAG: hypothetical protein M1819_005322 [Sarea resinae]
MAPDLNSLPPSRSPSASPMQTRNPHPTTLEMPTRQTPSPSPRSPSVSLAAAATMNAGFHNQDSRRSSTSSNRHRVTGSGASIPAAPGRPERRRSSILMNINLNDPSLPGPGELGNHEHRSSVDYSRSPFPGNSFRTASPQAIGGSATIATGDPHHQRAPSLGEIHQELEQEQEAQVNRLLQMIRQQQAQIQQMQQSTGAAPTTAVDDSTPTSEQSLSFPSVAPPPVGHPRPRSPVPRTSFDNTRQPSRHSRTSSRTTSPALRPLSTNLSAQGESSEWLLGRDESAYYQAETQNLTRENQILRARVRELEHQINDLKATPPMIHSPTTESNLAGPPLSVREDKESSSQQDAPAPSTKGD